MGWIGSDIYLVAPKRRPGFSFFQLSWVPNMPLCYLCPHIFWVYYFSHSQCVTVNWANIFRTRFDVSASLECKAENMSDILGCSTSIDEFIRCRNTIKVDTRIFSSTELSRSKRPDTSFSGWLRTRMS